MHKAQQSKQETEGMQEAERFFAARPQYTASLIRFFGEQVFVRRNRSARGDGFRRMAYIISQQRSDKAG